MHTTKKIWNLSADQFAILVCVITASGTIQDNAVLQYCFGFAVGFAKALFHAT
jgi:hypothetical protein